MQEIRFTAILKLVEGGRTATYVEIPFPVEQYFGARGLVKVSGTLNGAPFRSSLFPRGDGTHYLVINQAVRSAARALAGETVELVLALDTQPREVTIPPELQQALTACPPAWERFRTFSFSHQNEYASWVDQAKKAETRHARAEKAIQMILAKG